MHLLTDLHRSPRVDCPLVRVPRTPWLRLISGITYSCECEKCTPHDGAGQRLEALLGEPTGSPERPLGFAGPHGAVALDCL